MQVTRFPSRTSGVAERMSDFIAHLRLNGFMVGPKETQDALGALGHVDALDPAQARLALRVLLASDEEAWHEFDDLFDAFWFNAGRSKRKRAPKAPSHTRSNAPVLWKADKGLDASAEEESAGTPDLADEGTSEAEGVEGRLVATRTENLSRRDLREIMDEETLREAERAARRLARAIRDRRSRRRRIAVRGSALDLRRTLRASIARGGEPIDLYRRTRPPRPMKIVAICDVSGSMMVYSRVFLAFIKGILDVDTKADAYLFHTRLIRVTDALRDHDSLRAAGRLSLMAEGFGGGTDIAGCLSDFCNRYAAAAVDGRTVVIILSDGYCTQPGERMAAALSRLRRKAGRIVWLNPLKGWKDYEPVAKGIAAALPFLDAHLPANTIDSLKALESEFEAL